MTMETEIGVMPLQAKECQQRRRLRDRHGTALPWSHRGRVATFIWTSSLWSYERRSFCRLKLPNLLNFLTTPLGN